jgi:hypothetical protein
VRQWIRTENRNQVHEQVIELEHAGSDYGDGQLGGTVEAAAVVAACQYYCVSVRKYSTPVGEISTNIGKYEIPGSIVPDKAGPSLRD